VSESTRHRQAFEVYWRLGPYRTIERLREALLADKARAPSLRTLYQWSSQFGWQQRIAAIEREARQAEDEERQAEIRTMYQRQANEGLFLQQRGLEWLETVDPEAVSPEAALRAIVEGAKLERISRGEPTERQELTGEVDTRLTELSDGELYAIIEHVTAALGGTVQETP
jgi:hypothetical protein